jgi:hypothetical protein
VCAALLEALTAPQLLSRGAEEGEGGVAGLAGAAARAAAARNEVAVGLLRQKPFVTGLLGALGRGGAAGRTAALEALVADLEELRRCVALGNGSKGGGGGLCFVQVGAPLAGDGDDNGSKGADDAALAGALLNELRAGAAALAARGGAAGGAAGAKRAKTAGAGADTGAASDLGAGDAEGLRVLAAVRRAVAGEQGAVVVVKGSEGCNLELAVPCPVHRCWRRSARAGGAGLLGPRAGRV